MTSWRLALGLFTVLPVRTPSEVQLPPAHT